jgi:hypothetical protein
MRALSRKFKAVMVTVFCALLLLTIYGLASVIRRSSIMAVDASATKSEVLQRVPIGAPIEQARSFMTSHGFKCLEMKNQRYADFASTGRQVDHGPADFLWCDSGDRMTWSIFITKRWQVMFENKAGNVSDIGVGVDLTGL